MLHFRCRTVPLLQRLLLALLHQLLLHQLLQLLCLLYQYVLYIKFSISML